MTSLARILAAALLLFACADAIAAKRANFGGTNPGNTWHIPADNPRDIVEHELRVRHPRDQSCAHPNPNAGACLRATAEATPF